MLEIGQLLYFAPPKYAGGKLNVEYKKRIMLVLDINKRTNMMTLINISSLHGKPRWFTYKYNYLIKKFNPPLPVPSFAKLNDNYIIEYNHTLKNFLYKNGAKLDREELKEILRRRKDYIKNNSVEEVIFSSNDILNFNK